MSLESDPLAMWHAIRERLCDKCLQTSGGGISIRVPGTDTFWFVAAEQAPPEPVAITSADSGERMQALHARVYAARPDVCAIASGSGRYGCHLLEIAGELPVVFDEQARHLGRLWPASADAEPSRAQLSSGTNVLVADGELLVLGMTAARLVLNAELFEKCACAYVLAVATGAGVRELPWIVRHIAHRRLRRDQRRAARRVGQGLMPEETRGY